MGLSGAMEVDQGVAVAALVEQLKLQSERAPTIALGDDAGIGRQHRRERRRELPSEGARKAVWGIDEDEIVLTSGFPCTLEKTQRGLAHHLGLDPQGREVAA